MNCDIIEFEPPSDLRGPEEEIPQDEAGRQSSQQGTGESGQASYQHPRARGVANPTLPSPSMWDWWAGSRSAVSGKLGGQLDIDFDVPVYVRRSTFIDSAHRTTFSSPSQQRFSEYQFFNSPDSVINQFSIFPLPLFKIPQRTARPDGSGLPVSPRARSNRNFLRGVAYQCNLTISALNALAVGDCVLGPVEDDLLIPAQRRTTPITLTILSSILTRTWIQSCHLWGVVDRPGGVMEAEGGQNMSSLREAMSIPETQADLQHIQPQTDYVRGFAQISQTRDFRQDSTHMIDGGATTTGAFTPLVADRLALPGPGEGGTTPLLDLLPTELKERYATEEGALQHGILKSVPPSTEELKAAVSYQKGSKQEYLRTLRRLYEAGMIDFTVTRPKAINSVFAVKKNDKADRFIVNATSANVWFNAPAPVLLSNGGDLVDLYLPSGRTLNMGSSDVNNMYHKFNIPFWLSLYLGFPAVWGPDVGSSLETFIFPVCITLPMGWSHSVLLAHSIHSNILHTASPDTKRIPVPPLTPIDDDGVIMDYIDDHQIFSTDLQKATDIMTATTSALDRVGLTAQPSKQNWPSASQPGEIKSLEGLGISVSVDGWVMPGRKNFRKLHLRTREFIIQIQIHPYTRMVNLASLLGSWIWILLLNRPFLSILSSATFNLVKDVETEAKKSIYIPMHVIHELRCCLAICPMLMVDLSVPHSNLVTASDASMTGGGVVTSHINIDEYKEVAIYREKRGWYTALLRQVEANRVRETDLDEDQADEHPFFEAACAIRPTQALTSSTTELITQAAQMSKTDWILQCNLRQEEYKQRVAEGVRRFVAEKDWQTVISTKWKHDGSHINQLEGHALLLSIRYRLQHAYLHRSRPVFLCDSMVVIGCLAKGRSSSTKMNHLVRRSAALLGAGELRPLFIYVPTDANPADAPSREFNTSTTTTPVDSREFIRRGDSHP
jgi:hypothetical protein